MESLRWRQGHLKAELGATQARIEDLNRQEASLTVQLRAVEQLLSVEEVRNPASGSRSEPPTSAAAELSATKSFDTPKAPRAADFEAEDWSGFGPKARKIYMATASVLREAGVPLHYRALAEEIQKQVPLTGSDPGATLIAHLHRAQHLFPRVARGVYGLAGAVGTETSPEGTDEAAHPAAAKRRVRRRRRSR